MYKKILILLDGSSQAETILPHVCNLAKLCGATVIILQVLEPVVLPQADYGVGPVYTAELDDIKTSEAQQYLQTMQNRLSEEGIASEIVLRHGAVVASIVQVAGEKGADLIAMASHGRTGFASIFYGSRAADVLQRIDQPLLLVRMGDD